MIVKSEVLSHLLTSAQRREADKLTLLLRSLYNMMIDDGLSNRTSTYCTDSVQRESTDKTSKKFKIIERIHCPPLTEREVGRLVMSDDRCHQDHMFNVTSYRLDDISIHRRQIEERPPPAFVRPLPTISRVLPNKYSVQIMMLQVEVCIACSMQDICTNKYRSLKGTLYRKSHTRSR